MRVLRLAPRMIGAAALVLVALRPARAGAADFEVQADTALQAYAVSDPWGEVVLQRRRFMQTVGLSVYNLQGKYRPGEADYRVVTLLRLNADFGINGHLPANQAGAETDYSVGNGVRFVPGLEVAPLDLMYGYIEGRNIAGGLLGFKLGRQYMTDVLGWWSFDGGLVRVTTPFFVQAEIYGGLEQRGGLPLSTSRFERQGIWRGSHSGFGSDKEGQPSVVDFPSYQYAQPAPAFGVALESAGPSFVHGRFSYRRVYNTGSSIGQQFPDYGGGYRQLSGTRISQDRLGYALDINKSDLGGLRGGLTYDLYNQLFATYYAGLEAYPSKHVTVGADLDYFDPTFDADSIWNWFTHGPTTTISGRVAAFFSKRFDLSVQGGARLWVTGGDPKTFGTKECQAVQKALGVSGSMQDLNCAALGTQYFDPSVGPAADFARDDANRTFTTTLDGFTNLNARYRYGPGNVSFRGMFQAGSSGSREGGDVAAEHGLDGGRYTFGGRASLYGWNDPTRPDRRATSFGYMLAAGYKPVQLANFRVEFEHDMNRLIGQRFRVLGLINLLVVK